MLDSFNRGDVAAVIGKFDNSGVPFEWRTFAVVRVRDAKIVGVDSFLSSVEALDAAGLSE